VLSSMQKQTQKGPEFGSVSTFHFRRRGRNSKFSTLNTLPLYNFGLRTSHERTLLPEALASVHRPRGAEIKWLTGSVIWIYVSSSSSSKRVQIPLI